MSWVPTVPSLFIVPGTMLNTPNIVIKDTVSEFKELTICQGGGNREGENRNAMMINFSKSKYVGHLIHI